MIKVLIVDDEMVVRIGIRSMIDWNQNGFQIVGEAANGDEALQLIEKFNPHIVLTDIKMRNMDGITLMKEVKALGYTPKFIILSCYNDFELVKEALKLGASDYILKLSMQPQDLLDVMNTLKEQIIHAQSQQSDLLYLDGKTMNWKIEINDYLLQNTETDTVFHTPETRYIVMVSKIYHLNNLVNDSDENTYRNIPALNFAKDIFSKQNDCDVFFAEQDLIVSIVKYDYPPEPEKIQALSQQIARLQNLIETHLNCITIIGISLTPIAFTQTKEAFLNALKAAEHGFYFNKSAVVNPKDIRYDDTLHNMIDFSWFNSIYSQLVNNDYSSIENNLNQFFEELYRKKNINPKNIIEVAKIIVIIFNMAVWNSLYFEDKGDEVYKMLPTVFDINLTKNLEQIQQIIFSGINAFKQLFKKLTTGINHNELLKLREHIKDHFMEKITLNDAAIYSNLSKNYFCSIFKLEFGETFNDYITKLKIDYAKKLLKTTNIPIKEIADKCGYDNISYFYTIFHKATGATPKKYRQV